MQQVALKSLNKCVTIKYNSHNPTTTAIVCIRYAFISRLVVVIIL